MNMGQPPTRRATGSPLPLSGAGRCWSFAPLFTTSFHRWPNSSSGERGRQRERVSVTGPSHGALGGKNSAGQRDFAPLTSGGGGRWGIIPACCGRRWLLGLAPNIRLLLGFAVPGARRALLVARRGAAEIGVPSSP